MQIAFAICNGVISNLSCPIPIVTMVQEFHEPLYSLSYAVVSGTFPPSSLGRSIPVRWPISNAVKYSFHFVSPVLGFLYFGLMLTASGPTVLEYNCRLGDPETQPLMMRMDFDLALALEAAASRKLSTFKPAWKSGASVCVVMASGGYPGSFETGKKIEGLAEAAALPEVAVFHAGTRRDGDCIVTNGGRVLGVTAAAASLEEAIRKAYNAVDKINFEGAHFRTDIGAKGAIKSRAAGETPRG